jgi:hypothetical protein
MSKSQTTADTIYEYSVKVSKGKVVAGVARIYRPGGRICSASHEYAILTPDEARDYAADLMSAAAEAEAANARR